MVFIILYIIFFFSGKFFRQYLDPLSRLFQNRAIDVYLNNKVTVKVKVTKKKNNNFQSKIANEYRNSFVDVDLDISFNTQSQNNVEINNDLSKLSTEQEKKSKKNNKTKDNGVKVKRKRLKKLCPTVFLSESLVVLNQRYCFCLVFILFLVF